MVEVPGLTARSSSFNNILKKVRSTWYCIGLCTLQGIGDVSVVRAPPEAEAAKGGARTATLHLRWRTHDRQQ